MTPPGQPKLPALVSVGDFVLVTGEQDKWKVIKILGPFVDSGPGLWVDRDPRPPYYSLVCMPHNFVFPQKSNIRVISGLVAENLKIMDLYKRCKRRVFVIRKSKVGKILDAYRVKAAGVKARGPADVYPSNELNRLHRVEIPESPNLWTLIFNMTKEGAKRVPALVRPGDDVTVKPEGYFLRVMKIEGPFLRTPGPFRVEKRPPYHNLIGKEIKADEKLSRSDVVIPELVAVGSRILGLYRKSDREVIVVSKGHISKLLEKYR
jgi:hypothetical protein